MVNTNSCTASFTQLAGIAALQGDQTPVADMVAEFKRRRDLIVTGLNALPGVSCKSPRGAFYVFPNVRGRRPRRGPRPAQRGGRRRWAGRPSGVRRRLSPPFLREPRRTCGGAGAQRPLFAPAAEDCLPLVARAQSTAMIEVGNRRQGGGPSRLPVRHAPSVADDRRARTARGRLLVSLRRGDGDDHTSRGTALVERRGGRVRDRRRSRATACVMAAAPPS
jgi:hypothetical protein